MSNYPLHDNVGPFPGNGYPVAPNDQNAELSAWGRLTRGKTIGKKDVLFYDAENPGSQKSEVDIVDIGGENADAQPIILTLGPPLVVPLDLATVARSQNITGEVTNFGMRQYAALGVSFPGTSGPIVWPLLEALIEWGIGGVQCQAVVDFVNGLTINLTASFVRVTARVASTQRSGVIGTTGAYVLSGFVGPGFTTARVAQKTVYVGVVAADGAGVEATLALGAAMSIGDMVLEWNVAGDTTKTVTVVFDPEALGLSLSEDVDGNTTITIPEAAQFSHNIEDLIGSDSTVMHVKTPDSNPDSPWFEASGGPFAFSGGSAGPVGESEVFSVPRFAKEARLLGMANGTTPPLTVGTIRFWQSPDGNAGASNVGNFFFSGNSNAPVEIPNGAMYFSVVNGQSAEAEFGVVFDLAI